MSHKDYGRILEVEIDRTGRKIVLHLNIYKHIINFHNKFELWTKYWQDIIRTVEPKRHYNAWYYNKDIEGHHFQIRVVKDQGQYMIKTAIMTLGPIDNFRRIKDV